METTPLLLHEFFYLPPERIHGRVIQRVAVRAIVQRGGELLMVYSSVNGDYKFPGGGVQPGESHIETLARELSEECGVQLLEMGAALGRVIEYMVPKETEYDVFRMCSSYYFCAVSPGQVALNLDDYERELGFQPVWIEPAAAIATNHKMLRAGRAKRYTERDTWVLEQLLG